MIIFHGSIFSPQGCWIYEVRLSRRKTIVSGHFKHPGVRTIFACEVCMLVWVNTYPQDCLWHGHTHGLSVQIQSFSSWKLIVIWGAELELGAVSVPKPSELFKCGFSAKRRVSYHDYISWINFQSPRLLNLGSSPVISRRKTLVWAYFKHLDDFFLPAKYALLLVWVHVNTFSCLKRNYLR